MIELIVGAGLALAVALPIASRWQIPLRPVVTLILAIAVAVTVALAALVPAAALDAWWRALIVTSCTIAVATAALAYRFYRDPERHIPDRDDAVLSPADGRVVYVLESTRGELPVSTKQGRRYRLEELTRTELCDGDAMVIGISMNLADVHVNRAPIAGRVTLQRRYPGPFGSLRQLPMIFENERATTVIVGDRLQVAVVQIASRLVRKIASYVTPGDELRLGTRIGAIRFGSQVDVVIGKRADLVITATPGDRVVAGESVIATIGRDPAATR